MIIDIHGHVTHPELLARFPMPPSLGDIDGMIERKLAAGIELTIVGSPVGFGTMMPVPGLDNYRQPLDRLCAFHDWLFGLTERYAGRLLCYAYTNPFGDDALLERTAQWATHPGVVGIIANTSVNGTYVGADGADPFWSMAQAVGLPVFLHPPAQPVGATSLGDARLVEQIGRYHDVAAALSGLVLGGVLERFPGVRVIGATGGGGIGTLVERLDAAQQVRHWGPAIGSSAAGAPAGLPAGPSAAELVGRLFVDTAVSSTRALQANVEALGAGNVLFGTDSPPIGVSLGDAIAAIRSLDLPASDVRDILGGNARRLFHLDQQGRPLRTLQEARS